MISRIGWRSEAIILSIWLLLCTIGLVMATSASMEVAATELGSPWYFSMRHAFYLSIAAVIMTIIWQTPLNYWYKWHKPLFLFGLALIVMVLTLGIGERSSDNWQQQIIAFLSFVPSSGLFIFVFIIYLAAFLARIQQQIGTGTTGLIRIITVTALPAGLIFAQPDFGTAALIVLTAICMLLVAGWPVKHWLVYVAIALGLGWLASAAQFEQMHSATVEVAASIDQYDGGSQLTQALVALGRGHWFGLGLGQSIQKMMHFEPGTDFVFAILGEELGFAGALAVLGLFVLFILIGLRLVWRCLSVESYFAAFLVTGVIGLVGMQAFINIGVNVGMLPINGLVLPFMSYDGNSLIVCSALVGLLLRAAHELTNRLVTDAD